ncbi:cystathionine beta-lyase [Allosphingosinicella indica]|uniref:Cystathionine beta-lyase n=1 Tax=Allosphingosinicella indica TaxID=941907 RepID=A0A1X7FZA3_9SPHN|nr:cystathionine beta-lyase [Allosphingosinicella indica]SMF61450.1 cystathionine beta-lyase [Allosphingosinicella indica]
MGRRSGDAQGDGARVSGEGSDRRRDTTIVQAGRRREWIGAAVNPPTWHASTILFDTVAEMEAAAPADGTFYYGRHGTPTTWALSEALTALEPGAVGTRLFPSGAAAVAMALLAVLRPGDELLMVDSAYGPTRAICDSELKRLGITTRYYDPLIGADIAALIGDKTRAIFLESPGSLTFEVQDVPAIVAVARERGIATLIDNTWATPLFFPAIAAGVDISILACTKYIGGHSDLMMGSVTVSERWWDRLRQVFRMYGQAVGPDDAAACARGLRTLGVRMERHQANALTVANWLANQPQVARVLHPALADCPGHALWSRDFKGSSGLFSIILNGGDAAARAALIDGLEHFAIGYSWGGYESLAVPADPERLRSATPWQAEGPLVRLHIGLEDPDDLIEDLARGLARYPA